MVDSRPRGDGSVIRRRRECPSCGRRFTTQERVEELLPLVVKKDGRREPFDRMKILAGMRKACQKRPVGEDRLEEALERVVRHFQGWAEREVSSSEIGERVMEELHRLDEVAYVRFASVYRSFQSVDEFFDLLRDMGAQEEPS